LVIQNNRKQGNNTFPSWSLGKTITGNRKTDSSAFPSWSLGMRENRKIGKQKTVHSQAGAWE
jgi:hypothetical protein